MHRSASFLVLLLVAAHAAGCGGHQQGDTPPSDASADGAGKGAGKDGGSDAGDGGGGGAGDAGTTTAVTTFPLGTYDDCVLTTFLKTPGGGGGSGNGGSVTLGQSGSTLTVSYGGDGGLLDASFAFTQTSGLSASLETGQQVGGIQVTCAPLESAPSVVQLGSGSLTYNDGELFLSVLGTVDPFDAGGGCSNPGGEAALAITCSGDPASPSPAAGLDASASDAGLGSDFAGVYSCASSVTSTSGTVESVSGGTGTLSITETGGVVTAAYANDPFVQGSWAFVATTEGTAFPATANQSIQVDCVVTQPPTGGSAMITVPVKGSALTIEGSSVVLSFAGTTPEGSTCGGGETDVSIVCGK